MKQKIPCFCDNDFFVEIPDAINLDKDASCIDKIMDGSFMNFICPSCGKKHKPEFPVTVLWPSKNIELEVLPEFDRGEFYRRKKQGNKKSSPKRETVIGYPEMADRIAVVRDGLEPIVVEAIKYYLQVKAEETYPDAEIHIWYQTCNAESLEFHIHGIHQDEIAVSRIPIALYKKTKADFSGNPKSEIFRALRIGSYCSISNMLRPEELK
ncbi:MAG: CpXC domain-containing protein [Treponema sp.]|nr:CpXC domain-containing protein [Treponema sp.]